MKLTHRQETFILHLLDLYRELNGPIHYTTLAERVGVSPFTAYDMLRLLEEKGFVRSEYRIEPGKTTVGRSEVVYFPTRLAYDRFTELVGGADQDNWENVKSQILARIRAGDVYDRVLAENLLAHIPPDAPDNLCYCFEVIAFMILRLENTSRQALIERIPQIVERKELISKSGMLAFCGFVLGLLANESSKILEKDHSILEHVQRFQVLVMEMEPSLCRRLADSIQEMFPLVLKTKPIG